MAKIQPAVMNLRFEVSQDSTKYIDISQCASIVNRRFYRQGLNWVVAGFTAYAGTGMTASFTIAKLPQTWAVSNSFHKSFAAWQQQMRGALEEGKVQSTAAKYRDFKIHMNDAHVQAGFAVNELPIDFDKTSFLPGEWEPSEIVIPNDASLVPPATNEYMLQMVGPDTNQAFGMIYNYEQSRSVPHSPDPDIQSPQVSFYSQMVDLGEIQDDVIWNATRHNDDLPYNQDDYPGGAINAPTLELVHKSFLNATNFHQVRHLSGTNVPCGLLEFAVAAESTGPVELIIHLVPGPERGYLTQKMQDM